MKGNSLLCSKGDLPEIIANAEKRKAQILQELKAFINGNIDINIRAESYLNGYGVEGDLLVNGEVCRKYEMIDLLFLDLNELMLSKLAKEM